MPDQPAARPGPAGAPRAEAPPAPEPEPALDPAVAALLAFTPVPRLKDRSNGWKPEVQRAFIAALAETGSVRAACRRVGRSEFGAYALRHHPEGAGFAAAWRAAQDLGVQRIEDVAMDRAVNGVEVPVYSYGKLVGTRTAYNDRLLMFILRNRAPERFAGAAAGRLSALDKATLARLKEEWRAEWEAERAAGSGSVLEAIDRQLDTMRNNWLGNMSPRARAAYERFLEIEKEDGIDWMPCGEEDEDDGQDGDGARALIAPPPARPDPQPEPEPPAGPRIRTLRGEWD